MSKQLSSPAAYRGQYHKSSVSKYEMFPSGLVLDPVIVVFKTGECQHQPQTIIHFLLVGLDRKNELHLERNTTWKKWKNMAKIMEEYGRVMEEEWKISSFFAGTRPCLT